MSDEAELLAALQAVLEHLARVTHINQLLIDALKAQREGTYGFFRVADGREVSPGQLVELDEQLAADRATLDRFRLRVAQLQAQQRTQ